MFGVELYRRIRFACHREGMSQREAALKFGVNRRTVSKALLHSVPPGYRLAKPRRRPKLGPFTGIIDQILEDDKTRPKKQHHTAKRIFERLQVEHGFDGGYTIVKDYIQEVRQRTREVFVPLHHAPGHAQADFGEALAVIDGVECKIHFLVIDLPHSDAMFVKAYPRENSESFCDGHVAAFEFFGGVPQSILYDNTKIAVARILGNGERQRTQVFSALQSHYLFKDRFGRPARGNDKGKVEGMVGYARRNFMVPIPRFASFADLNEHLADQCHKRQQAVLRGHKRSIGERFENDANALAALPRYPYQACDTQATRVNSLSMVRYRGNDYSVPVVYAYHDVVVRGFVDEVVISNGLDEIARHQRSYSQEDAVFDPMHYLALLEKKVGAFDQAAPMQDWNLPEAFARLHKLLQIRMGKKGKREFIQVLRLMETFDLDVVHEAIKDALHLGAIGYDAVKHLVLCRIEHRPPRLDLDVYPYLPKATVQTTDPGAYMGLLAGSRS